MPGSRDSVRPSSHSNRAHGSRKSASEIQFKAFAEDMSIEADGELDASVDIHTLVQDEELNAAFEAEHGTVFAVKEDVRSDESMAPKPTQKFIIPKKKRPESENTQEANYSSGEEGKREWRKKERDINFRLRERDEEKRNRSRSRGEINESRGDTERDDCNKPQESERSSLFDTFAAEGLISADDRCVIMQSESEGTSSQDQDHSNGKKEAVMKMIEAEKRKSMNVGAMEGKEPGALEEGPLEIAMGRDSLVFVRDYYPWQVRVYPINKADVTGLNFAQVWTMADSSSVVWSNHEDFGGVAEFLLKDRESIQKLMRKVLWHNYSSECITVEVTERGRAEGAEVTGQEQADTSVCDTISNQAIFLFHNKRARQLIKTYYPTAKGEVTERSLYVNNVGTGVSTDIMKAIFPCALKISVAKAGKEASEIEMHCQQIVDVKSSALVQTESEEATFNYLVVYNQIRINDLDLVLSSVSYEWEEAKKKFQSSSTQEKKAANSGKGLLQTPTKRSKASLAGSPSAKRGRLAPGPRNQGSAGTQSQSQRGQGPNRRGGALMPGRGGAPRGGGAMARGGGVASRGGLGGGGAPRGRDAAFPGLGRGRGRVLLPNPVVGGGPDSLLPLPEPPRPPPLLNLPHMPPSEGMMQEDYMLGEDMDRRTAELQEIHQQLETQVRKTRATLIRAARQAEVEADFGGHLPPPPPPPFDLLREPRPIRPSRPVDYPEEIELPREPSRRTLLPMDSHPVLEHDDRFEDPGYRRPRPPPPAPPAPEMERDYRPRDRARDYTKERREKEDHRSSARPRPYLLEPPKHGSGEEEKDLYPPGSSVYEYGHTPSQHERDSGHGDRHYLPREPPARRPASLERERPSYPDPRSQRGQEHYDFDYESREARRPRYASRGYEDDSPSTKSAGRYREEYDRRY